MTIQIVHKIRCDHCGHTVELCPEDSCYEHPDFYTFYEMIGNLHYCKAHGSLPKIEKEIHKPANYFKSFSEGGF